MRITEVEVRDLGDQLEVSLNTKLRTGKIRRRKKISKLGDPKMALWKAIKDLRDELGENVRHSPEGVKE